MRKADVAVQEVVCSETGKPMAKIPLWMADIQVKFVSDEARQKHSTHTPLLDHEPERRSIGGVAGLEDLKEVDTVGATGEEEEEEAEYTELGEENSDEDY